MGSSHTWWGCLMCRQVYFHSPRGPGGLFCTWGAVNLHLCRAPGSGWGGDRTGGPHAGPEDSKQAQGPGGATPGTTAGLGSVAPGTRPSSCSVTPQGEAVIPLTSTSPLQDCPLSNRTVPGHRVGVPTGQSTQGDLSGLPGSRRVASAPRWVQFWGGGETLFSWGRDY